MPIRKSMYWLTLLLVVISAFSADVNAEEKKDFTFVDAMKFKSIRYTRISEDGKWVVYSTMPDRGNPTGYIRSTEDTTKYKFDRCVRGTISKNSEWVAFKQIPDAVKKLNAKPAQRPKSGLLIVNTNSAKQTQIEKVTSYKFSNDSQWIAYYKAVDKKRQAKSKKFKEKKLGSPFVLKHLESGTELKTDNVTDFHFDSTSKYIFYTIAEKTGKRDGLYYRDLSANYAPERSIMKAKDHHFANIMWNTKELMLAFTSSKLIKKGKTDDSHIHLWNSKTFKLEELVDSNNTPENWFVPTKNSLAWTDDGQRLYFGFKPVDEKLDVKEKTKYTDDNYYDIDTIRQKIGGDIWHWDDPRIIPNQKKEWNRKKNRTYKAVYSLGTKTFIQLADQKLNDVIPADNPNYALAYDNTPYLKNITFEGWYNDIYIVDIETGDRTLLAKKNMHRARLSPGGKYVVYFENKNWMLYSTKKGKKSNLTAKIAAPFYNEDNDTPAEASPHGIAGWFENDDAVLIYDKFDVWRFFTATPDNYSNFTDGYGREHNLKLRIKRLDREKKFYSLADSVIMSGFHYKLKTTSLYTMNFAENGLHKKFGGSKLYTVYAKAKRSDELIISRQSYDEYPDLQLSNTRLDTIAKLTDMNAQLKDYKWGKSELIDWQNSLGDTLQGVVIRPEGFDKDRKYPVLVYFYDQLSHYLHYFMTPRNNSRPCFQIYQSDDYVIFIPDIKYIDGRPGFDATDALTSGAQKLIDMGIADPDKIGIQGHSWGGYQTAFIITQTDMFKAACAGAPVGNMTSAYSGIRLGSGLARQFQYERQQSRIGGNIWDSTDNYIKNSPIFYANKINTPLLIMFGDIDDAVPWEQGIELYLALRRSEKDCIFLQYHGEPHHPRKYINKLDYAIKMKEFFDYHLLGKEPQEWIKKGKAYKGK